MDHISTFKKYSLCPRRNANCWKAAGYGQYAILSVLRYLLAMFRMWEESGHQILPEKMCILCYKIPTFDFGLRIWTNFGKRSSVSFCTPPYELLIEVYTFTQNLSNNAFRKYSITGTSTRPPFDSSQWSRMFSESWSSFNIQSDWPLSKPSQNPFAISLISNGKSTTSSERTR